MNDTRSVSSHTTIETTAIYNKANIEKAQRIAVVRRAHVPMIAGEKQ